MYSVPQYLHYIGKCVNPCGYYDALNIQKTSSFKGSLGNRKRSDGTRSVELSGRLISTTLQFARKHFTVIVE
jgi:hypothetical protein